MSVYVVIIENEYYKQGTYLEDIEGMLLQPMYMVETKGRYLPMYPYGIAYPRDKVRKFILKLQNKGLDREALGE